VIGWCVATLGTEGATLGGLSGRTKGSLDLHGRAVSNVGEGVDIGRTTDGTTRVEDGDTGATLSLTVGRRG
jgi:hypothetical protein